MAGRAPMLLDAAVGTALEAMGVDTSPPLWSARALLDAPDALKKIHESHLRAGADAITTATFRLAPRALAAAGLADRAFDLVRRAVDIAGAASEKVQPDALILGSVGPLADCYRPQDAPQVGEAEQDHAERIDMLVRAGVDIILIETMNNVAEALVAARAAHAAAPGRWILSVICDATAPGRILSGEPMADLLDAAPPDPMAVGVNCVAAPDMFAQLCALHDLRPDLPLIAYANTARLTPEGAWERTDSESPQHYAEIASAWLGLPLVLLGGCCGTTADHVAALRRMIDRRTPPARDASRIA